MSRKYAYQVLPAEELARWGVQLVFVHGPSGATPEDALLVQFQGMIAEYERAQIVERSRQGKRHRAQQGAISVLGGAPYEYRYVKKRDTAAAYYEIVEAEAEVVRMVFEFYIQQALSINAIARRLNEREIPTRTGTTRWERSTVWRMLRNPAYSGHACFGKTEVPPRATSYQEGLMTLEQLRGRIPELRKRQQGVQAELRSLPRQRPMRRGTCA